MARIYIEKINTYIDDESNDMKDMSTNATVTQKEYDKRMKEWMDTNKTILEKDSDDN